MTRTTIDARMELAVEISGKFVRGDQFPSYHGIDPPVHDHFEDVEVRVGGAVVELTREEEDDAHDILMEDGR